MGKSILDFTSINGHSGTEFTQVKGRSGTVFWCKPYVLTLSSKPTGVDTITCYRYSSLQPGASTGTSAVLTNGSTIYHGDVIYISATASSGYYDPTISSSTGTISSHLLEVNGNETITVTAGALATAPVYIAAGTGVSSVYLSSSSTATSGSASGTAFNIGSTVYAFVVLATGFNHQSGWTLVSGTADTSGAIYRIGSKTVNVDTSQNNFGTISASRKQITVTFSGTNCTWGSYSKTAYYGDTLTQSGNTITCSGTANWSVTVSRKANETVSKQVQVPVYGYKTISVSSYWVSYNGSILETYISLNSALLASASFEIKCSAIDSRGKRRTIYRTCYMSAGESSYHAWPTVSGYMDIFEDSIDPTSVTQSYIDHYEWQTVYGTRVYTDPSISSPSFPVSVGTSDITVSASATYSDVYN